MEHDWGLTKGGVLPAFLRPIQCSIDEQNKRYWVQRFVRICVHIHIARRHPAHDPGDFADWWEWIRRTA